MKLKRTLIIILCIVTVVLVFKNRQFGIFLYETDYRIENDSNSLIKLCLELKDTNEYNKQIIYYKEILDFEEFEKLIVDNDLIQDSETILEIYDYILYKYLLAYLKTQQYELFLNEFNKLNNSFKKVERKYHYLYNIAIDKDISLDGRQTMLKALQNIDLQKEDFLNKMGNLNTQSMIYEILGDKGAVEKIESRRKRILEESKK